MVRETSFSLIAQGSIALLLLTATPSIAAELHRTDLNTSEQERVEQVTAPAVNFTHAEAFEAMQGGATTLKGQHGRTAFQKPAANLPFNERQPFELGRALFKKFWVASPTSTLASDGLGPLYNARSCHSCHLRNGRGIPPNEGAAAGVSFIFRLIRPGGAGDPVYGKQLQDISVPGLKSEGHIKISYDHLPVTLTDGTVVDLRKPHYAITGLGYGQLDADTIISPRIAQPIVGLGLLEAIAEADIAALADPDDTDGDGISGRLSWLEGDNGAREIGRFGWKAEQATVYSQSAAALHTDIGISSPTQPAPYGDCTPAQTACFEMANGVQPKLGDTEAPDPVMELLKAYVSSLAVPARRNVGDAEVLRGKALFYQADCPACHHPKFVTSRNAAIAHNGFQLIWPYSDMLLHDMGEALADETSGGVLNAAEWRTPPLWGIGLNNEVNGRNAYMHDGRARTLEEAILWHGGEASMSQNHYKTMESADRLALIRFLESL